MVTIAEIRSAIFVPADRPERFEKAANSGADAVILDLEDAVAAGAKAIARGNISPDFTKQPVIVRINAYGTQWHAADLGAVADLPFSAIMVPKAEDPAVLAEIFARCKKPLIALVETALGIAQARGIASASGVERLAFGSVDFCADLGCAHMREVLLPVRMELVIASRLAGLAAPIDGVTVQLEDPRVSFEDATHARSLGMGGKLCIHPKQVGEIKRAFRPSEAELAWAHRALRAGDGAVSVDGAMVDEPVRLKARALLAAAP